MLEGNSGTYAGLFTSNTLVISSDGDGSDTLQVVRGGFETFANWQQDTGADITIDGEGYNLFTFDLTTNTEFKLVVEDNIFVDQTQNGFV